MTPGDPKVAGGSPPDRARTEVEQGASDRTPGSFAGTRARLFDQAGAELRAEVELTMADLIGDDRGEIVFFNDSGVRSLGITTGAAVVAKGSSKPHVTASGADVTGYSFVSFDNGLTLYFEGELDLIVHRQSAAI